MKKLILGLVVLLGVLITACGQKGNLYLPTSTAAHPVIPASAPSK